MPRDPMGKRTPKDASFRIIDISGDELKRSVTSVRPEKDAVRFAESVPERVRENKRDGDTYGSPYAGKEKRKKRNGMKYFDIENGIALSPWVKPMEIYYAPCILTIGFVKGI